MAVWHLLNVLLCVCVACLCRVWVCQRASHLTKLAPFSRPLRRLHRLLCERGSDEAGSRYVEMYVERYWSRLEIRTRSKRRLALSTGYFQALYLASISLKAAFRRVPGRLRSSLCRVYLAPTRSCPKASCVLPGNVKISKDSCRCTLERQHVMHGTLVELEMAFCNCRSKGRDRQRMI